jgi:hypothetical protein
MAMITKEDAKDIVKKFKAHVDTQNCTHHDMAIITYNGKIVKTFGISRSPRKDKGHGHIPNDLAISPRQTKLLAQCHLEVEEYFDILREKNML